MREGTIVSMSARSMREHGESRPRSAAPLKSIKKRRRLLSNRILSSDSADEDVFHEEA